MSWEAGHAVVRSLVADQEFIVRVGKFEQLMNRFSKGSLASLRANDDRPERAVRHRLSVHKEPNEILVGRRQTLGEMLAEPVKQPLIRFVQGPDRSQHDRVDEERRG